jgi:hypothetical protein
VQIAGFQLQPLANFEKQLTGVEWMNSFPERTPAESREKRIYPPTAAASAKPRFNDNAPLAGFAKQVAR